MAETTLHSILTDAIRYWELRRVVYNAILVGIVVAVFMLQWPASRSALSIDLVQGLFILAILANVAYCAAYVVDIVAQYSAFSAIWKRYRWLLFAIGVVFAGIIARFIAAGLLGNAG
jgi:hypothetical protein